MDAEELYQTGTSMNDIYRILERLDAIKEGTDANQNKVKQLPALFKPKSASPALAGKYPTKNATRGYMVGEDEEDRSELAEAMSEIEEDMLSKVKKDLTNYLDMLEKKVRVDRDLRDKAVDAVEKGQAEEDDAVDQEPVGEDPTTQDNEIELPPMPQQDPITAESFAVKTVAMEDGAMLEIHGDVGRGFEIRRQGRSMPSKFLSLEEAEMAIELFRNRRKQIDTDQDYLDEA
jgi:hypothetical protein